MITKEFLNSDKSNSVLKQEDLDTTNFILSLYESDDIDISEAQTFLSNYVTLDSPLDELALKYIAYNFKYFRQKGDTISYNLEMEDIYDSISEHSVIGFYGLLIKFIEPSTEDWELKQVSTYSPANNKCIQQDYWVSKNKSISLDSETATIMLGDIICSRINEGLSSLQKQLYKKLHKEDLDKFFDLDEIIETYGYDNYGDIKRNLLL